MRRCYLLAGFLGTEMSWGPNGDQLLWVDYHSLALGQVGRLRLAAGGADPGEPDGIPCVPGFPLANYFGTCLQVLTTGLLGEGYLTAGWGYDWRRPILTQGALLADEIRRHSTAAEPASIVAHSQGGLVARAAWSDLVVTGEQALLRRIVTLGTAHLGTYAPVSLWSGDGDLVEQLAQLTALVTSAVPILPLIGGARRWTVRELAALSATWPSLYELLPLVTPAELVDDPHREALYLASRWPSDIGVSQAWLDHSRGVFGGWLRSPASRPPAEVMTCVAGTGYPTPHLLVNPDLVGDRGALSSVGTGDGTVTEASALALDGVRVTIDSAHTDLPRAAALSGQLVGWVLAERSPGPAAAELVQLVGIGSAPIAGPPLPAQLPPGGATGFPLGKGTCPGLAAAARRPGRTV